MKISEGLRFKRYFTDDDIPVIEKFKYIKRNTRITGPEGNVVYEQDGIEVPENWSQVASDVLAQKYFRRTGVPREDGSSGGEYSIRQVVHRMAVTWKEWGKRFGYFATDQDAAIFYDESVFMLLAQLAAPNSPQWFNTGLYQVYGITGPAQGHYYVDEVSGKVFPSENAYGHPQPHACFILSVKDDLLNTGGIMDLLLREARIFKYGSGVGTNFSAIRGVRERLSGGGYSSGLMSFLKIGDVAAGAIRSGGTTRRAAKMVCLDIDHPEIMSFINWKAVEEEKAAALIRAGYSAAYEGEAYQTVSGQNSNNSIRIPDEFFKALADNSDWILRSRTDRTAVKAIPAVHVWSAINHAAWRCGDPGLQFDTTINDWNTCPNSGRIRASNPCSEYMFLDDTACNLASLNLLKFMNRENGEFDTIGFNHACRIWTVVLEISVLMAQYPSAEVAVKSSDYRTLGLGFTNLGAYCMEHGWPYDSKEARGFAAAVTALMTGTAYHVSAELAGIKGAFRRYEENKEAMLQVLRNHQALLENSPEKIRGLSILPEVHDLSAAPTHILTAARKAWKDAILLGEQHGFRNAQVTVIAPTGTIGLVMDCDTTGIEPEYSLVKEKRLSGGGTFRIVNQRVQGALTRLGYQQDVTHDILAYIDKHATIAHAPRLDPDHIQVFACSMDTQADGLPSISPEGHLKMMAVVQPFISGAISKTVNLPNAVTEQVVKDCFFRGWQLGLKSIAIYRDGCKVSQPLTTIGATQSVQRFDDTPVCTDCGFRTIRSGSCFSCPNCGTALGCS